jgi:hypothetical protein
MNKPARHSQEPIESEGKRGMGIRKDEDIM